MRKPMIAMLILFACLCLWAPVQAQDFSTATIQKNYQVLNARNQLDDFDKQIESIVKLFSSLVGSGFVHTASLHNIAGIDVGARAVIAAIPDEFKDIVPDNVPNVKDPLSGTGTVPLPFLHGSIGLPGNLEVMAKFISFKISDNPDESVTLLGGAVKYGLLRGNAGLPAITLLGGYQTLRVPNQYAFGNVATYSLKGYISKGFLLATIYGGGGIDRTDLKIDIPGIITREYKVTYPSGTIGLTITPLPLLKVNADYNFGALKNITLGASLSIR